MQVGTKELKNRLSHYLRLVRAGEPVLVTDRGVVVAELRAVPNAAIQDEALEELARQGVVTLARGRLTEVRPVRRKKRVLVSEMVVEDRR
jgi:antitoxin (DNA-binding transcriptional repressor) of toxin-antitoxin stability system